MYNPMYLQLLLPTVDNSWTGITALLISGADLALPNACYVGSDGKMELASANGAATMPVVALAVEIIAEDARGAFLLYGFFRHNSWNWTPGGLLYPSTTPGKLSQMQPSGTGKQVQVVGRAWTANIILFNPSLELVEIQ